MQDERLPLTSHLEELRWRLIKCVAAVAVGFCLSYNFAGDIFHFLVKPFNAVKPAGSQLIFTSLPEAFVTNLKIAFFAGLGLSLPVIFYQLWRFISPGLYERERRYVLPFVLVSTFFFIAGAAFAFYVVFPVAFKFFLEVAGGNAVAMLTLKDYLDLVVQLLVAFGVTFELPVIMYFLAKMGVVNYRMLAGSRKYALLVIVIVAAILTPPDVISQILLSIPLLALYELSIWVTYIIEKKRKAQKAAANAEAE